MKLLQFSTTKLESQQPNRNYATRYIHYTATPMRPAYVQVYVSCWVERQDHGLRTYDGQIPNSPQIENPEKCIKILAFCRKNGLLKYKITDQIKVRSSYGPLAYFSDIFISGKNVAISAER